jgi:iron complex outermembrane recepter protein
MFLFADGNEFERCLGDTRMSTRMFLVTAALFSAAVSGQSTSPKDQTFNLSIKRGSLTSVLEQFSEQTHLEVGAEIKVTTDAETRTYGPFQGAATPDRAMRALLAGTDVSYAWQDVDTIRLFRMSSQRTLWKSGVSTAREASHSIQGLTGVRYDTGLCGEMRVGPLSATSPRTAEEAWIELIRPHCRVIQKRTSDEAPGTVQGPLAAGQTEHRFSIPPTTRVRALRQIEIQGGVDVTYLSSDPQEELATVGPITGGMSANAALTQALRDSALRVRWMSEQQVRVEPAYTTAAYADMSECACSFGLPELWSQKREHVTVVRPRIRSLEDSPAPPFTFDRSFIDATGATSIPELLNYLTQQAFSRSRGYRANAAQYLEGRGFGAQYTLVLINGHRAYGGAADPLTNAFDLNGVPLSAVERIDIALDQPSVLYGTDAVGGTINIILKHDLGDGTARTSVGAAEGGAERRVGTLLASSRWRDINMGFVLDHLSRGDLLGAQRDRWRNQDYTRYAGGVDYRVPFGAPPNVRSTSGTLPGLDTSRAAFSLDANGVILRPNDVNLQSALSYAAIVPKQERTSLYAFATTPVGDATLNLDGLFGRQSASLPLFPVSAAGLTWGANHPQNPFGTDVLIDALLTGLPARGQRSESTLSRITAELSGTIQRWNYSAFVVRQEDRSQLWIANDVDPSALARSLIASDPAQALNILTASPGEGTRPAGLLLPHHVDEYVAEALQTGFNLAGHLFAVPAGNVTAHLGVSHRDEAVRFDTNVGHLDRDISSLFARVRVPLVSASSTCVLHGLDASLGVRRDFHSDVTDVTTWQSGLTWQPFSALKVYAAYSELFRPPTLYELYLPRFDLPVQLYDPQRNEVATVALSSGGNRTLQPTDGQAVDIGLAIHAEQGWIASLNYWDARMRNRISAVLIQDLLNTAADDVAGRISREERTAEDIANGRPGRLRALDVTRANFGAIHARGIDFALERSLETSVGQITPRLDASRTLDFRYRDLPMGSLVNRVGVASLYGTVPAARAVLSVRLETQTLRASAFLRHHASYEDYSPVTGTPTGRRIPSQTLLDFKVSMNVGAHFTLSVGANNALDDRPPNAHVGGWEGVDPSQGDLVGREAYVDLSGSF